jgi:hypothetical protein
MVAYSFNRRFVPAIQSGVKQQTIRRPRTSRPTHVSRDGLIQLYTAMRTKQCRLIGTATAQTVERLTLHLRDDAVEFPDANRCLTMRDELDMFARRDGFATWADLKTWWGRAHPDVAVFHGVRIIWGSSFIPAPIGQHA